VNKNPPWTGGKMAERKVKRSIRKDKVKKKIVSKRKKKLPIPKTVVSTLTAPPKAAAPNTGCFDDPRCADIRQRLATHYDKPNQDIACDTKLDDYFGIVSPGAECTRMINDVRASMGKGPLPAIKVEPSKTVGDLCKLLALR
jgi:hypothetical protein